VEEFHQKARFKNLLWKKDPIPIFNIDGPTVLV